MTNDESNSNDANAASTLGHSVIDSSLVIRHSSLEAPPPAAVCGLRVRDYLLLAVFCALLFGYVAVSGRPMTMHEARLPQLSREMMQTGDYLVPHSGVAVAGEAAAAALDHDRVCGVMGQHCDTEWSVRIPPAVMGLLVVLMTATLAGKWFGRSTGLLAGFCLATMYEFYYYSTLSEDDIFLAVLVVGSILLFVWMEFFIDPDVTDTRLGIVSGRPWPVVAFFLAMGLSNMAKGPLVGAIVVAGTLGVYLVWQKDWKRMRRYVGVWGWLMFSRWRCGGISRWGFGIRNI